MKFFYNSKGSGWGYQMDVFIGRSNSGEEKSENISWLKDVSMAFDGVLRWCRHICTAELENWKMVDGYQTHLRKKLGQCEIHF